LSFAQSFHIYTDGSKDGISTAAAVVALNSVKTVRLPDNASIFTAEIHALDMALDMALDIIRRTRSKDYVGLTESCKVQNPLILKILKDHNQLINSGKYITFCWIPSHVGIRGNEDADIAAKAGLDVAITNITFPVSDLSTCVSQLCVKEWQQLWNQCTLNNRSLVAVLVRHWADTTQSSSTVFELVIQHRERVSQYVKLAILHSQLSTRCSAARQRYFGVATLGTFLKMLHLTTSATSSLLLKISAFTIVYNVFFTLA